MPDSNDRNSIIENRVNILFSKNNKLKIDKKTINNNMTEIKNGIKHMKNYVNTINEINNILKQNSNINPIN